MSERIGVVLAKYSINSDKVYAYEMPPYSDLKAGDIIIVKNKNGDEEKLTVVATNNYSLSYEQEEFDFLCIAVGATKPLCKVVGQIIRKDFNYKEDKEGE